MSTAIHGDPAVDDKATTATGMLYDLKNDDQLRNLDYDHIKELRKACQFFLMQSEPYIVVRLRQSPKINNGKR